MYYTGASYQFEPVSFVSNCSFVANDCPCGAAMWTEFGNIMNVTHTLFQDNLSFGEWSAGLGRGAVFGG